MKNLSLTFCLVIAALLASVAAGIASDLPPCPSSEYKHNCFGSISVTKGQYVGEWQNGKPNGKGTFFYADGEKYVGTFENYSRNGHGVFTFSDGAKYVGNHKDGEMNGHGIFTWANGDQYVGEFKNGKFHGKGIKTYLNSTVEEGIWKDGWFQYASELPPCPSSGFFHNCFGTYTWENGKKYVGEWQHNHQHGQGTLTFSAPHSKKGDKYVGEFSFDKKHGQGVYTYVYGTGPKYVGEWKDDKFQYAKKLSPPVPVAKTPTQDDEIISASSGSGFAVSSDGYVITNHHVIEGCQKVMVHTKGKELPVTVVTYDPQNDLALLKGDFRPKTVFPLSNNRPELLQDIYVAGFPFGNKVSTSVKVTKGIISSLTGIGNNFSNIQIDAALQSGNSGGPILDDLGNVVGVAVSKLDAKYMFDNFGSIPENTNFGIKSIIVRSVLDSNGVNSPSANQLEISKSKLGKMISSGTYYISCWMTMAEIKKMQTKKVFFSDLD